jgi:hypothetical protein
MDYSNSDLGKIISSRESVPLTFQELARSRRFIPTWGALRSERFLPPYPAENRQPLI